MTKILEVDDFNVLELIPRFNDIGRFMIDLPMGGTAATELVKDHAGIIIEKNDVAIFSGDVQIRERMWDSGQDVVILAGSDDTQWLDRRLALPSAPPYTASAYDIRTDVAETVLKEYVDNNAGPSAAGYRQVPGLTIEADAATGSTVTGKARFDSLLLLCQELALAGGDLGFKIIQSGSGLEFQVFVPTDKTTTAVFSKERGNLLAFHYRQETAKTNYVVAGGGGEGVARTFRERGYSASIVQWGRTETFKDQRHTTNNIELRQAVGEELFRGRQQTSLSITPEDTDALAYPTDYNLGDKVTVMVDGTAVQDVIREVKITLTRDQDEVIRPTVGTPGRQDTDLVNKTLNRLYLISRRLMNLERR